MPKKFINGIEVGRAALLATGQSTVYAGRDDAGIWAGIPKPTARYQVNTTGIWNLTTPVYLPTLARNDIAFVAAGPTITAAAGLDVVKTGDVIRIRGSGLNETEYTVAIGNVANLITLTGPPVDEAAGAWITIAKQALQSNNVVVDLNTSRPDKPPVTWLRYGSYSPAKLGAASDGKLLWTATAVSIHAANNDLKVTTGGEGRATYTIIGGFGEVLKYWPGYSYSFTIFAGAAAKLPGYRCISVTVNGADLDILMDTGNQTVATEAGPINGVINLSCNGIFSFANACIQAQVGGYSDWRVANAFELMSLGKLESATVPFDSTAFPSQPNTYGIWTSSTQKSDTTKASYLATSTAGRIFMGTNQKGVGGGEMFVMLLRGGV